MSAQIRPSTLSLFETAAIAQHARILLVPALPSIDGADLNLICTEWYGKHQILLTGGMYKAEIVATDWVRGEEIAK